MVTREKPSWIATANAAAGAATATRAAPAGGLSHFVTSISASFSSTESGALLTLKSGTTELGRWYVYDSLVLSFDSPIQLPPATVANLELAAGTGTGAVTMTGYTL